MDDAERIRRAVEDGEYWGDVAPLLRDELVRVTAERDRWLEAFALVMDGNSAWYDIHHNTALQEDECRRLESLAKEAFGTMATKWRAGK